VHPQTRNHRETLNDSSDLRHQRAADATCSHGHALQKSLPEKHNRKRASIDTPIIANRSHDRHDVARLSDDRREGDSPFRIASDDLFYRADDFTRFWTAVVLVSGQSFFRGHAGTGATSHTA
jgi:hypothetical protein